MIYQEMSIHMSLRGLCVDDVSELRRELTALADACRARATSSESFADVLARRLSRWHLAPTDAGEKTKRDEDDTGDQKPKRVRPDDDSETPPNLFDDNFEESEPPAPDQTIVGLPPQVKRKTPQRCLRRRLSY